jgi:hypothetical protein
MVGLALKLFLLIFSFVNNTYLHVYLLFILTNIQGHYCIPTLPLLISVNYSIRPGKRSGIKGVLGKEFVLGEMPCDHEPLKNSVSGTILRFLLSLPLQSTR